MPSSSSTVTRPFARATAVARVSARTSMPASAKAAHTSSPAKGSSRASTRGPASMTVTREPKDAKASAISTPTVPPPRTTRLGGTSSAVTASRLVHGRASRSPGIGGTTGSVPVAMTTARRAASVSSPTCTVRSPVIRPWPRTSAMPRSSSHGVWLSSSRWLMTSSRRSSAAGTSRPSTACAAPGMRRASASTWPGRSSALDGMQP